MEQTNMMQDIPTVYDPEGLIGQYEKLFGYSLMQPMPQSQMQLQTYVFEGGIETIMIERLPSQLNHPTVQLKPKTLLGQM